MPAQTLRLAVVLGAVGGVLAAAGGGGALPALVAIVLVLALRA